MNPFKTKTLPDNKKLNDQFKELRELLARMCLTHAEEAGTELNLELLSAFMKSEVEFTTIYFRVTAEAKFNGQPKIDLPMSERIAIAAHEAYKKVTHCD